MDATTKIDQERAALVAILTRQSNTERDGVARFGQPVLDLTKPVAR